ncbi:MAG: selenocysteine-specific translation elongation factor, partial [Defluviitaleaceae bacterium]|nr:selenocysteine-specific translation elongation factor [Defluviitaleaceae bacterium]
NNAIIGTAGHVDHGKTLLIKALTGQETDRLKEEKKRGITIELGFAHLALPGGGKAGIIDVPGHEKFVRNMLAGAGSIDLAMLVIAADEGVMPQTREHLAILKMLGISRGLVVINKIDLVEADWLEVVTLDIEEELAGSFLENAPIMPVSAYSGQGIDELRSKIFEMLEESPEKNLQAPFRMPVDRVFIMDGFGTVVTGTLIEGTLKLGDEVEIFPSGLTSKARRIQVHGEEAEVAYAGQRVALNVAGLKVSDLAKGDWIAAPKTLETTSLIDIAIKIDKDFAREIKNNTRLHLYHGTRDVLCNLVLLDEVVLKAGDEAYGQLRLEEPLSVNIGDRFVLRFYSPLETVGGGVILDPIGHRMKRVQKNEAKARFAIMEKGSLVEKVEAAFAKHSPAFPRADYVKNIYFHQETGFDNALQTLMADKVLISLKGQICHKNHLATLGQKAQTILNHHHAANPLQQGMPPLDLISRLLPEAAQSFRDQVLAALVDMKMIKCPQADVVAHIDFKIAASSHHDKIQEKVLKIYIDAGFAPPDFKEVAEQFSKGQQKEKQAFAQVFEALVAGETLIPLTPQTYVHKDFYPKALGLFNEMHAEKSPVDTKEYRDRMGVSRKYAMAFLEDFDKKGITQLLENGRVLL